ncbi:hypothetical protein CDV57_09357, partial [Aspergillus fumigatus]
MFVWNPAAGEWMDLAELRGGRKPPLTEGPNLNMCQAADLGRMLVVMVLCSLP